MALSDVINRKWVEPQIEKYMVSRREVWRKRDQQEGRDAERTAWRAWLNRRDAAVAKGEPFDEPAPDEQP